MVDLRSLPRRKDKYKEKKGGREEESIRNNKQSIHKFK